MFFLNRGLLASVSVSLATPPPSGYSAELHLHAQDAFNYSEGLVGFPQPRARETMTAPPQTTGQRPKSKLTLPALKSLGDLANAHPIIEIDSGEQTPLVFTGFRSSRSTKKTSR